MEATLQPADLAWFDGSQIVDDAGQPLVLYHGTPSRFRTFEPSDSGAFGPGIYLTPESNTAQFWGGLKGGDAKVIAVIAKIMNPYYWSEDDKHQHPDLISRRVRAQGHDGIVCKWMDGSMEIVAFNNDQLRVVS